MVDFVGVLKGILKGKCPGDMGVLEIYLLMTCGTKGGSMSIRPGGYSRWLTAVVFSVLFAVVFSPAALAIKSIVPQGSDFRDFGVNSALASVNGIGACSTVAETVTFSSGTYTSDATAASGTVVLSAAGATLSFDITLNVNLDVLKQVQTDDTFVLGSGDWELSNLRMGGMLVGNGAGNGNMGVGGFIFTSQGTANNPQRIDISGVTAAAGVNIGGLTPCSFSLSLINLQSFIPRSGALGASNKNTAIERVIAQLQRTQVQRAKSGVSDAIRGWQTGLVDNNVTQAGESVALVPLNNGIRVQGLPAGDGFDIPWGMWAMYEYSDFEDDFVATAFEATRHSALVGMDINPYEGFLAGVALGYANTDMDTFFNGGNADFDEISIIPYAAWLLSEHLGLSYSLSVDAMLGYTHVDVDQHRVAAGTRVDSSTSSNRLFFSSNLTASQAFDNVLLTGRFGWLVARDKIDGFTESSGGTAVAVVANDKVSFAQLNVGAEAAYLLDRFEPYARLDYEYDYSREQVVTTPAAENDADQFRLGAGVRLFADDTWSGSLAWNRTLGRSDFSDDTFSLQLDARY